MIQITDEQGEEIIRAMRRAEEYFARIIREQRAKEYLEGGRK